MPLHLSVLVVVEPCAAHVLVFHGKAQGFNEVQGTSRVGRQANHIARVGRNFWFNQNNLKHGAIVIAIENALVLAEQLESVWGFGQDQGAHLLGAGLL